MLGSGLWPSFAYCCLLRPAVSISSYSRSRCHLIKSCSFLSSLAQKQNAIRITSSFSIMHDMPRIITYTTSSVLRLIVVYHRCGVCVRTKSVMIALRSDIFARKQQYHPPYHHHITQRRRKVKSLCKMFPQALRQRFLHVFAKAKDLSLLHIWSLRRKRSASEICLLKVEADLVLWLNYDL